MRMSDKGIFALALHEGIVPGPYRDSEGIWTYGVGHTAAAGAPNPAAMPRGAPSDLDAALRDVFALFRRDLAKYEAEVLAAVRVPVSQPQFDALVSFHYNTGGIARARITQRLNAGDINGASEAFGGWMKPKAVIARRKAEQALFRHGHYPGGDVPVWGVDDAGRVIWRPVRRLSFAEVLDMMRPAQPALHPITAAPRESLWASLWRVLWALITRKGA